MSKVPLMLFIGFCLLVSCKTHSSLSKTPAPPPTAAPSLSAVVMDSVKTHEVRFEWFSGKAKIEVTRGSDKTEFTVSFRIRNDSAIWVSISPGLGLEVARVLITADSLRVMDRMNDQYYSRDYTFFKPYTSLPVTLQSLQDLIEGNILFAHDKSFEVMQTDSSYLLKWKSEKQSNTVTLDDHFKNLFQMIADGMAGTLSVSLEQYDAQYTPSFSLWRKIELINENPTQIVITFSKVKLNEPVRMPFDAKN